MNPSCVTSGTLFSIAATLLQRTLGARLLSPMMIVVANPWMTSGLLVLAAVYQLTPIKRAAWR